MVRQYLKPNPLLIQRELSPRLEQHLEQTPRIVPISNVIECAGCGARISVGKNCVFAYCGDCSAKSTGKKR